MAFNLDNLYKPEKAEFLPHKDMKPGEGIQLELNLDILTLEFMDEFEKFFSDWTKNQTKKNKTPEKESEDGLNATAHQLDFIKLDIKFKSMLLAGKPGNTDVRKQLIAGWDVVDKEGQAVPVSYETVSKFGHKLVNALHDFCMNFGKVEKKSELQSGVIS